MTQIVPFLCQSAKGNMNISPRFLFVAIQLGLQLQAGHDMSSVKDSLKSMEDGVSAVKDGVKAVEEGMNLNRQASFTGSCKKKSTHTGDGESC